MWKQPSNDKNEKVEDNDFLSHSEYVEVYNKWHADLGTAFIGCLKSKEYMHNRTSLVILTRMVSHFPTKSILGEKILDALEPLQRDNNPMQDIKAMAQGYSSQLVKARSEGVWREESEKATKEREEREKQVQEEKRLKREKNLEEMEKDSQEIFKNMERDGRDGRRRQDRPYGHNAPSQMQRMGNANPHQRDRREQRQAPPPTSQGIQGRWERV